MPKRNVTVIVGGQYGSEGKGKVVGYLAPEFKMFVRTGGPNAGHTVEFNRKFYKLRTIPCGFVNKQALLGIGAGAVVDLEVLKEEIQLCTLEPGRLIISPKVGVITKKHIESERFLKDRIGSTGTGVGAAMADRIRRKPTFHLLKDIAEMKPFLGDVAGTANKLIDSGENVLIEGTQGFGLSLYHGFYPYVTGRDTSAASFCSEVGIAPSLVKDVILVIRPYPIRVGGNSGPLTNEISWETLTKEAKAPSLILEKTTVTKRIRRVGRFNLELVKRAVMINRPTQIAINFMDYLDYANRGKQRYEELTEKTKAFINMIEKETHVPVTLLGTGPLNKDMIDLRAEKPI